MLGLSLRNLSKQREHKNLGEFGIMLSLPNAWFWMDTSGPPLGVFIGSHFLNAQRKLI